MYQTWIPQESHGSTQLVVLYAISYRRRPVPGAGAQGRAGATAAIATASAPPAVVPSLLVSLKTYSSWFEVGSYEKAVYNQLWGKPGVPS